MNRPVRKYVEKLESVDFSAGTYNSRRLPPRARYNRIDFQEYLSEIESLSALDDLPVEDNLFTLPAYYEEDVG